MPATGTRKTRSVSRRTVPGELHDSPDVSAAIASVEEIVSAPAPGDADVSVEQTSAPMNGRVDGEQTTNSSARENNQQNEARAAVQHRVSSSGDIGPNGSAVVTPPATPPKSGTPSFTLRHVDWAESSEDDDNVGGGVPAEWIKDAEVHPNLLFDILKGIEDPKQRRYQFVRRATKPLPFSLTVMILQLPGHLLMPMFSELCLSPTSYPSCMLTRGSERLMITVWR